MHLYQPRELRAHGLRPVANLILPERGLILPDGAWRDTLAIENAKRLRRRLAAHRCSALGTGTFPEVPPVITNCTALANSLTETSLLTGSKAQPKLQPPMLDQAAGRGVVFEGWGILGTTSAPTMTFKAYLNTTQGIATLGGTTIAASAAITCATTVSNKSWFFKLYLACATPGDGSGNATLYVGGSVKSPAGFASPFEYTLGPGTGDSATVSVTLDGGQNQWFNLSGTWSAANASNTIQLIHLQYMGLN